MNIFILDYNPVKAAQMQCDKHIVKMSLETAQLLCSAFPEGRAPYKRTHYNHPCAIWSRISRKNYLWLIRHGLALCDEYSYRYGKIHKSKKVILWCQKSISKLYFPREGRTHFVLCFDAEYRIGNAVQSYRCYYQKVKHSMADWKKGRKQPKWWRK